MLERWGFWLILISLAMATTWFLHSLQEEPSVLPQVAHVIDYTLDDFTATQMDEQGQLRSQLTAKKMLHYQADKDNSLNVSNRVIQTELIAPYLVFYQQQQPIWRVQAERGDVSADNNEIWLRGHTTIWRDSDIVKQRLQIISQEVHVQLDIEYAETAAPSKILTYNGETESVGMRVFMPERTVELLSNIRGHYLLNK